MEISSRMSVIPRSGIREIFDLAQQIPNVINFGIGEPNFSSPDFVKQAAKKAIDEGFDKYTINAGIPELREEISRKLKEENRIDSDPAREIIVTSGATQAIFLVMYCLLNESEEVLLPSPIFTAYEFCTRLAGGTPVEIPLKREEGYKVDPATLSKYCSKKTKLLVLNSPCNPTGSVYSREEIQEMAQFAVEHKLYLISDEIYEKYVYGGARHYSPASEGEFKDRIITVNGFSKTYAMTGWRLGYAAASSDLISAMTRFNMYNSVCPNSIAQKAGIAALRGGTDFLVPILAQYERRRDLICKRLDEMGLPYAAPSGAFYVFPDISSILREPSVSYCKRLLLEEHVATVPGSSFGRSGEGHIRLSYSVNEESLQIGMDKIEKFNKNLGA